MCEGWQRWGGKAGICGRFWGRMGGGWVLSCQINSLNIISECTRTSTFFYRPLHGLMLPQPDKKPSWRNINRDRCWEVKEKHRAAGRAERGVETALTLSKSIPVKSQVPIQVLLEEEGTEPERSPWEELLLRHILSLSQHLVLSALHGHPNERSKLTLLLGSSGGGRGKDGEGGRWPKHTHIHRDEDAGFGHSSDDDIWTFVVSGTLLQVWFQRLFLMPKKALIHPSFTRTLSLFSSPLYPLS